MGILEGIHRPAGQSARRVPVQVDADGKLAAIDSGTATGLGAPADSAATSDSGTFSLIALFKRLLGKLPGLGQQTAAASLSIVPASDAKVVVTEVYTPLGYQQLTSLSTAATLTVPGGAKLALLQAEGVDVRWRDDGTAPTATVGMVLYAGNPPLPYTGSLAALRLIESATGGKVNVTYFG